MGRVSCMQPFTKERQHKKLRITVNIVRILGV